MMEIVSAPLLHQDIARWVAARIPGDEAPEYNSNARSIGFLVDGEPKAAIVYYAYSKWNVMAAIAVEPGYALPRRALRAIFEYPFVQLSCLRMTVVIASKNEQSIKFCERLGFTYVGTLDDATPTDCHLIFGLLKRNCRWIPKCAA